MRRNIPKRYGQGLNAECPFCNRPVTCKNSQKADVCDIHRDSHLPASVKCICGDWADLSYGKFGPYYKCFKCGNWGIWKMVNVYGKFKIDTE